MIPSDANRIVARQYASPCGVLILAAYGDSLCMCDWKNQKHFERNLARIQRIFRARVEWGDSEVLDTAARRLDEYFAGERSSFGLPLQLAGTDFQRRVWLALADISYGDTVTYAGLAQRLGMKDSVRAVANACAANALSVVLPCHRVLGADGHLTGYAGGIDAKKYLLRLEGVEV